MKKICGIIAAVLIAVMILFPLVPAVAAEDVISDAPEAFCKEAEEISDEEAPDTEGAGETSELPVDETEDDTAPTDETSPTDETLPEDKNLPADKTGTEDETTDIGGAAPSTVDENEAPKSDAAADGESEYVLLSSDEISFADPPANSKYVSNAGITKAEFYNGSSWKKIDPSNSATKIERIRIRTYIAYYLLEYRVRTSSGEWLATAYSNASDSSAGQSGKAIANISIKVRNTIIDDYDDTDYVVMYRSKVAGEWLSWVSNGTEAAMRSIKSDFGLSGDIDAAATDSGWISRGNITSIQIMMFELRTYRAGSDAKLINAPYINQRAAGLPNGCEAVCATMALQHAGVSIDAETFITKYLPMGAAPSNGVGADPEKVYVGDPHKTGGLGWGCYAPVIVSALGKAADKTKYQVINATGNSLSTLCKTYIDNGVPVIVWATVGMTSSVTYSYWTTTGGKSIKYNNMLHCLLLVGYDSKYYYFNDPLKRVGNLKYFAYPKSDVESAYSLLGKQAVVLRRITCTGITLSSLPSKTEYFVGDKFSSSGLTVKAVYSDGTKKTVTSYKLSGADTSTVGKKTVTVTWNDSLGGTFTATFKITVKELPPVTGDADGDRALTMKDVLLCRYVVAGVEDESVLILSSADTDGDGLITMRDILYIRKTIAGV